MAGPDPGAPGANLDLSGLGADAFVEWMLSAAGGEAGLATPREARAAGDTLRRRFAVPGEEGPSQPQAGALPRDGAGAGGTGPGDGREGYLKTLGAVQDLCGRVLDADTPPGDIPQLLTDLRSHAEASPREHLRVCADFMMLPLFLAIESSTGSGTKPLPGAGSQLVLEKALGALRAVCERDVFGGEARVSVLQRLSAVLDAGRGRVGEEPRLLALQCMGLIMDKERALRAEPSRRVPPPFLTPDDLAMGGDLGLDDGGDASALRSDAALPIIGFCLSALVKCALEEVSAGASGSPEVRSLSVSLVGQVCAAVQSPDVVAAFLPGVASGLTKVVVEATGGIGIRTLGPAQPGKEAAAGAMDSLFAVVDLGLGDVTLGDGVVREVWQRGREGSQDEAVVAGGEDRVSLATALGKLKALSGGSEAAVVEETGGKGTAELPPAPAPGKVERKGEGAASLLVVRDADWAVASSAKVAQCLGLVVPRAAAHPSRAVRAACARGCARALISAPVALGQCSKLLLGTLLALAADTEEVVSLPAREALSAVRVYDGAPPRIARLERQARQDERRGTSGVDDMGFPTAAGPGFFSDGAIEQDADDGEDLRAQYLRLFGGPQGLGSTGILPGEPLDGDLDGAFAPTLDTGPDLNGGLLGVDVRAMGAPTSWPEDRADTSSDTSGHPDDCVAEGLEEDAVHVGWSLMRTMIEEMIGAAEEVCKASADDAQRHLGRLAMAIRVAGVERISADFLASPQRLERLLDAASGAMATDVSAPGLFLHDSGDPAVWAALGFDLVEDSTVAPGGASVGPETSGRAAVKAPNLPRAPPGLLFLHTKGSYTAMAVLLRCLGRAGSLAAGERGRAGSGLAVMCEAVLSRMRAAVEKGRRLGTSTSTAVAGGGWQSSAALWASVLAEVLTGASASWADRSGVGWGACGTSVSAVSSELLDVVAEALDALFGDAGLSALPTSAGGLSLGEGELVAAAKAHTASAREYGLNALALRTALEFCGSAAAAVGPAFCSSARLLPKCLVQLIERVADSSSAVAGSAQAALASVCHSGGYGSFKDLLSGNADFVVDRICARLRAPGASGGIGASGAALLASLLGPCGAATELIPLLAEPAQAALRGTSVRARAAQPEEARLFLEALVHVARGARDEAARVLEEAQALSGAGDKARRRTRVLACAKLGTAVVEGCAPLCVSKHVRVCVAALDACEASLAAIALANAGMAADNQERDQARAPPSTEVDEGIGAAGNAEGVGDGGDAEDIKPVEEEIPQLLPSVHALWHPLVNALRGSSIPVVEAAVACVAAIAKLADGNFLARRMASEAWPALKHLLATGRPLGTIHGSQGLASHRRLADARPSGSAPALTASAMDSLSLTERVAPGLPGPGSDSNTGSDGDGGGITVAPGSEARLSVAVAKCLSSLAGHKEGRRALRYLTARVVDAIVPLTGPKKPAVVREAALDALAQLAAIDADAAWGLLADVSHAAGVSVPVMSLPAQGPSMGGGREECSPAASRVLAFLSGGWQGASAADGRPRRSALDAAVVLEGSDTTAEGDPEVLGLLETPGKGERWEERAGDWPVARVLVEMPVARRAAASEARMMRLLPSASSLFPKPRGLTPGDAMESAGLGRLVGDCAMNGVGPIAAAVLAKIGGGASAST